MQNTKIRKKIPHKKTVGVLYEDKYVHKYIYRDTISMSFYTCRDSTRPNFGNMWPISKSPIICSIITTVGLLICISLS